MRVPVAGIFLTYGRSRTALQQSILVSIVSSNLVSIALASVVSRSNLYKLYLFDLTLSYIYIYILRPRFFNGFLGSIENGRIYK